MILTKRPLRWLVPKPTILEKIIKDREEEKQRLLAAHPNLPLSCQTIRPPEGMDGNMLTYICIMDDKYFPGRLDTVTKETWSMKADTPKPNKLVGLRLPAFISEEHVQHFIVHRISTTAAIKYGLRVKPRAQKRKKTTPVQNIATTDQVLPMNVSKLPSRKKNKKNKMKKARESREELPIGLSEPNPACQPLSFQTRKRKRANTFDQNIDAAEQVSPVNISPLFKPLPQKKKKYKKMKTTESVEGRVVRFSVQSDLIYQPSSSMNISPSFTSPSQKKKKYERMKMTQSIGQTLMSLSVQSDPVCQPSWMPYSQKILLDKTKLLYYKSPRGRFPKSASMHQILHLNRLNTCAESPGVKIRNLILDFPVHLVPNTADSTNPMILTMINELKISGKLTQMDKLLNKIVKFHKRIKNLAEFVKRCTLYWVYKVPHVPTQSLKPTISLIQLQKKKCKQQLSKKIMDKIPHESVLAGISTVLRISGCKRLLGSNYNLRKLIKFIKIFFLAGIRSTFTLGQLMEPFNSSHCRWLDDVEDPTMKLNIFSRTISWIFSDYVHSILSVGFYITELQNTRRQLNLYFQDTWKSLCDRVKERYIQSSKLKKIHRLCEEKITPTASLRFIPKNDDLRPILALNLKNKISPILLENIRLLLNYLCESVAPHATLNESRICYFWKNFLKYWKIRGCPKLYYLRMDISDAFPSVDTGKVHSILRQLVDIRKQYIVKQMLIGGKYTPRKLFRTLTTTGDEMCLGNSRINPRTHVWKTLEDKRFDTNLSLKLILKYTRSYEIVRIGKDLFTFSHGLAQGSTLSQSLCNIYYGHMEQKYLSEFLNVTGEFFLRTVDDYLYISPDPNRVASLYNLLHKGIPEYGCCFNESKSKTNLFVPSNVPTPRNEWIVFCGWKFNITNGHVTRDFRLYSGIDSASTMSFSMKSYSSPEDFISKRIRIMKPLRLCQLTLDPSFNSRKRIARTIFEAALMMSFKFQAACRILYYNSKGLESTKATVLMNGICTFATSIYKIVKLYNDTNIEEEIHYQCKCLKSFESLKSSSEVRDMKFSITQLEVRYIVYRAFSMKLEQHRGHKTTNMILVKLRKLIFNSERHIQNKNGYLDEIIGKSMPKYFEAIKI